MKGLSQNHWDVLEALRGRGFMVIVRLRPAEGDELNPPPHCTIGLRGVASFHGYTMTEAMNQLVASRCWTETHELEKKAGELRRSKVVDIIDEVKDLASEYSGMFRADQIAAEMGVFPVAVAHALKKLNWPRSQKKSLLVVNDREVQVINYLPQ